MRRALSVTNPHAPGHGRAVAQRLADQLGRSVPRARESSAASMATTAVLSLALAGTAGGVLYLGATDNGHAIVRQGWERLSQLGFVREQLEPARPKLLPDFPEGQHVPRTLVVDLEDTLVHLEWDRTYGWRAAKRPGVDTFLLRMAQVGYEIVLFTSGVFAFVEPFAYSIDPQGCVTHRLFRDSTTYTQDGERVKDLSRLNRDLRNVIAVDDDPREVQWQPQNLISIRPFNDARQQDDNQLLRLIPVLEDMVLRDVPDVRVELERLREIGKGDAVAGFWLEQDERVRAKKSLESKGLGAAVRSGQLGLLGKKKT